jgi:hypothetical protein
LFQSKENYNDVVNGLRIKLLSQPEAYFLKKANKYFEFGNYNLSECSNLECIFTLLYPKEDNRYGLLNYLFFLKTGYIISNQTIVPFVTPDDPKLTTLAQVDNTSYLDYSFKLDEMLLFNEIANNLPDRMKKLPILIDLHRLPLNIDFPETKEQIEWKKNDPKKYESSKFCGLALSTGSIILTSGCFSLSFEGKYKNYIYRSLTHEFAHQLDLFMGKNNERFSTDITKEWPGLSGWYQEITFDVDGKKIKTSAWKIKVPSDADSISDGFIREYAKNNPIEDFADSIGFFRYDAEKLKKVAPRKFAWISKNVFDGRDFSELGLLNYYSLIASMKMKNELLNVTNNCVINSDHYPEKSKNYYQEFQGLYRDAILTCLSSGLKEVAKSTIYTLKEEENEACDFFKFNEDAVISLAFEKIQEDVGRSLGQQSQLADSLKKFDEFKKTTQDIDPMEAILSCSIDVHAIDCYNKVMNQAFEKLSENVDVGIFDLVKNYKDQFLLQNQYANVQLKLNESLGVFFSGIEDKIDEIALSRFNDCRTNFGSYEHEGNEVLVEPISGGDFYIRTGVLNCINSHAIYELDSILTTRINRYGLSISKDSTKVYIRNLYLPKYARHLTAMFLKEVEDEKNKLSNIVETTSSDAFLRLTSNLEWLSSKLKTKELIIEKCQNKVLEMNLFSNNDLKVLFTSKGLLTSAIARKICKDIDTSTPVILELKKRDEVSWNLSMTILEVQVLQKAIESEKSCVKQFPKAGRGNYIKKRSDCLTSFLTWDLIMKNAIESWKLANDGTSFVNKVPDAKMYLNKNKDELQRRAIQNMNGLE